MSGARRSPASERNKGPIADVLADLLPTDGQVLEVASGFGQHVAHFAARFPHLTWQPTDRDDTHFDSIRAHVRVAQVANVLPPITLDVCDECWPVVDATAVYCANLTHIAPTAVGLGLMQGAARVLPPRGHLLLYGPFKPGEASGNRHTSPGNAKFDAQLRRQDPRWGIRGLAEVDGWAHEAGLRAVAHIGMPANNHLLVYEQPGDGQQ